MRTILYILIFILTLSIVGASLSDYPEPFVKDHYTDDLYAVLGRSHATTHSIASTNVVLGLAPINGNYYTRFEDEINSLNHNFISIGNPCENSISKRLLGTNDCNMGLNIGEGGIIYVNNNGYNSIIVMGTNKESLIRTSLVLKDYYKYDFNGNRFIVDSSGNLKEWAVSASRNVVNNNIINTASVSSTGCQGCLVDKTCVKQGDVVLGKYCDGTNLAELRKKGEECDYDYQCENKCAEGRCDGLSFAERFISWLRGLLGHVF